MDYSRLFFCGISKIDDETKTLLAQNNLGGVILYPSISKNYPELIDFFDFITKQSKKILISSDHEGGQLETIPFVPPFPGNMALGRTKEIYAKKYAKMSARIMKTLGYNTIFAPVMDLYTPKSSAVMGFRTLSSDPHEIVRYSSSFLDGYKSENMLACAKHFPGHGKAFSDSHETAVKVDIPIDVLEREDFLPFEAAVENGVELIMTSHVIYSAVDEVPATLSKKILTSILRDKFGYAGVILSDAMEMKAISSNFSVEEIVEKFFNAGGDMILLSEGTKNFNVFYEALEKLVKEGRISESKLQKSVEKVEHLINKYFSPENVGFVKEVMDEALEIGINSLSKRDKIAFLMPFPRQLSQADVLVEHFEIIEKEAKRMLNAKVVKYNLEAPKPISFKDDALIVDMVVDAFRNEKLIEFHKSLPQNTLYVISHDPYDKKFFKERNYVVTYSTTPVSMGMVFKLVQEIPTRG